VAGAVDGGSVEAIWIVADLLLLAGLLAHGRLWPFRARRPGRAGLAVALVGRLVFVAAELVSIAQHSDENLLLPVGALLTSVAAIAGWGLAAVLLGAAVWAQQDSAGAVHAATPAMSR